SSTSTPASCRATRRRPTRGRSSGSARRRFAASAPSTLRSGPAAPDPVTRARRASGIIPVMAEQNRQLRLASRPTGMVAPDNFELTDEPLPSPEDGGALVKVLYLSLDPAMRGWMSDQPSYVPPVGLGEVMRALGAGVVVDSK